MASIISTAFVVVKPDLGGFEEELRAKLKTSIGKLSVADRTITMRAQFEKGTREKLISSLGSKAKPTPFFVAPTIAPGSVASLRKEIQKQLGAVPVGIAPGSASGSASTTARSTGQAAAQKAAGESAATAAPEVLSLAEATDAAAAAATRLTKATRAENLALSELQSRSGKVAPAKVQSLRGTFTSASNERLAAEQAQVAASAQVEAAALAEVETAAAIVATKTELLAAAHATAAPAVASLTALLEAETVAAEALAEALVRGASATEQRNLRTGLTKASAPVKTARGEEAAAAARADQIAVAASEARLAADAASAEVRSLLAAKTTELAAAQGAEAAAVNLVALEQAALEATEATGVVTTTKLRERTLKTAEGYLELAQSATLAAAAIKESEAATASSLAGLAKPIADAQKALTDAAAKRAAINTAGVTPAVPLGTDRARTTAAEAAVKSAERAAAATAELRASSREILRTAGAGTEEAARSALRESRALDKAAQSELGLAQATRIRLEQTEIATIASAKEAAALEAGRQAQVLGSGIGTAGAGKTGAAAADAELAAANAFLAQSQKAVTLTSEAGLIAARELAIAQEQAALGAVEQAKASLAAEVGLEGQAAAARATARAEALLRAAQDPQGINPRAAAQEGIRKSIALERELIRLDRSLATAEGEVAAAIRLKVAELTKSSIGLEASNRAQLQSILLSEERAAALVQEANADATRTSQALRGAGATGATFLGLRGAVLSSSAPFLLATAAAIGFAKTIGTASQLEQSLNVFQATAGATAAQMELVSRNAKTLGADLSLPATSANDAAAAMTELAKAGLSVNNAIAASKGVLQLSTAANISVVDAAKIVATELNAFNLAGGEATRVADLLAGASKEAQGEITDFALAFQQVSAVANQVGLPLETTTALLTQFAKAGLRGSDAGTSLRTLLLRLVPTTKAAADAQASLGISLDKSLPSGAQFINLVDQYTAALAKLGPIAQQEALTQIFGQDAIRGASISLTKGSADLLALQKTVSEVGLAAEITAGRTKGLSGATEGLKSQVQTLAATTGTALLPTLTSMAQTLSSIVGTANSAADALGRLGKTKVQPLGISAQDVGGALGGGGTIANIGLALGAGFGIKALKGRRDARKLEAAEAKAAAEAVAVAEKVAATETLAAWEVTSAGVITATQVQTAAQIAGAEKAAAAQAAAARLARAEWLASLTAIQRAQVLTTAAAGRFTGILKGNKGLAAGIVGTIAGQAIQGDGSPGARNEIGGVVSGAAQGAVIGSIIPGVGTAVGAAGGAIFGAVTTASAERKAAKDKWNGLSGEDQWAWFLKEEGQREDGSFANPGRGSFQLSFLGFKLKPNPFAAQSAQVVGLPQSPLGLTATSLVSSTSKTGNVSFSTGDTKFSGGAIGDFLKKSAANVKENIKGARENAALQAELALAEAELAGDTKAADAAIQTMISQTKAQIDRAKRGLAASRGPLGEWIIQGAEREKLLAKVVELTKKEAQLYGQLSSASFEVSQAAQIALIRAGATEGLADDLIAQVKIQKETNAALAAAIKEGDAEAIKAARIRKEQQDATVKGVEGNIKSKSEADAKKAQEDAEAAAKTAIQNAETRLRIAADAAGNIGAAENKLIVFLRKQAADTSKTTAEQLAAQQALTSEIEKRKSALQAVIDAGTTLKNARLATQLARAQATPGIKDDKIALKAQITFNQSLIAGLRAEETALKKTSIKYKEKETAVQGLIQANIGLRQSIKGLNDSSGFSLNDLFKEALNQFQEFGSNVSGSPLAPGGARGAFAGNLISAITGSKEDRKALGLDTVAKSTSSMDTTLKNIERLLRGDPPPKRTTVDDRHVGRLTSKQAAGLASRRVGGA